MFFTSLSGFHHPVFLKAQTAGMERIKPDYEWGELMSLFIERMWRTAHFCKAVYVTADSTVPHESPVTASHHSSNWAASFTLLPENNSLPIIHCCHKKNDFLLISP